jgi:hypothetical protein
MRGKEDDSTTTAVKPHHDEVETVTLLRGAPAPVYARTHNASSCDHPHHSHPHPHLKESTPAHATPPAPPASPPLLDEPTLSAALRQLPKDSVYRVKGFIRFTPTPIANGTGTGTPSLVTEEDIDTRIGTGTGAAIAAAAPEDELWRKQWWILNWAFGRWELVPASTPLSEDEDKDKERCGVVRLTVMGERGEVRRSAKKLALALGAAVVD